MLGDDQGPQASGMSCPFIIFKVQLPTLVIHNVIYYVQSITTHLVGCLPDIFRYLEYHSSRDQTTTDNNLQLMFSLLAKINIPEADTVDIETRRVHRQSKYVVIDGT